VTEESAVTHRCEDRGTIQATRNGPVVGNDKPLCGVEYRGDQTRKSIEGGGVTI